MITATEKKTLKNFLTLAPEPEDTFTYDELLGYMFGLAMTPEIILPSEWMPVIFGGEAPIFTSTEQAKNMNSCLIRVYNKFTADFQEHKLNFPFDIEKLKEQQIATLLDWVSGFEEAICLREELWDPEEYPELPDRKKEELYQSMITVLGLVDPMEIMDFFATLPNEVFQDAFVDMDHKDSDRTTQIQAFLLASLPLAIETLQDHAYTLEQKRQQKFPLRGGQVPIQSTKVGRNQPCPCNSGKKFKICCGSDGGGKIDSFSNAPPKKSNIIKVDFPQHGKNRSIKAPVYQLKVGLHGAKPPIWRRIQVPGNTSLERLHFILQICMGWDDCHLHQFIIDGICYCITEQDDVFGINRSKDEAKYTLQELEKKISPSFQYIYDYGDDWLHKITVEKTLAHEDGRPYPVLITGRRACPPEDSGGIHNYMRLVEVLHDPEDTDFQQTIDWIGMDFQPAKFDKEEMAMINVVLKELFS